ncbi:hypothetical protein ACXR5E_003832 [Vibrio mimicus]|uniref:hypothetical protein n=1 Tax=Vibrio cholerae TaxID=666 RepID=UPI0022B0148E|nr:hypothetical protein [Vibrio cholerae]EGR4363265.1 hypothetical protein [Vibrio cholerae]
MNYKAKNIENESNEKINRLIFGKKYRRLDQKKLSRLIKYIIRSLEDGNNNAITITYHAEHTLSNSTASKIFESHLTNKEIRIRLQELANGGEEFDRKLLEFIGKNNNSKSLSIDAKTIKHAKKFRVSCKIKPWC